MKWLILGILFVAAAALTDQESWGQWKAKFGRHYSAEAEVKAFANYQASLRRVAELSAANPQAKFGPGQWADLSPEEFRQQRLNPRVWELGLNLKPKAADSSKWVAEPNTTYVDWREKGIITYVKDQGQCGSCWAFSVVEETESMWVLAGHPKEILAPQQVVDCSLLDFGCQGGTSQEGFAYIKEHGLEQEMEYPYFSGSTGQRGVCEFKKSKVVAHIKGHTAATPECTILEPKCSKQDEDKLALATLNRGPTSICVDADIWQDYYGGIVTNDCDHGFFKMNHCVQLVGYNKKGATPYWIVRNSWGQTWGEQGYIYIKMGQNLCGVANLALFADVDP